MATQEQIMQLRRMTGLDEHDTTYTGELLNAYIDNLVTLEAAAAAIWTERAAAASTLVDVTESGSSRRLSQLADNALKMRKELTADNDDTLPGGASFTVGVVRV